MFKTLLLRSLVFAFLAFMPTTILFADSSNQDSDTNHSQLNQLKESSYVGSFSFAPSNVGRVSTVSAYLRPNPEGSIYWGLGPLVAVREIEDETSSIIHMGLEYGLSSLSILPIENNFFHAVVFNVAYNDLSIGEPDKAEHVFAECVYSVNYNIAGSGLAVGLGGAVRSNFLHVDSVEYNGTTIKPWSGYGFVGLKFIR